jgi:hypothetical protein
VKFVSDAETYVRLPFFVNERPDGTQVLHDTLANLPALYDDRTPLLSRGISTRKSKTFFAKVRLTALMPADEQKH